MQVHPTPWSIDPPDRHADLVSQSHRGAAATFKVTALTKVIIYEIAREDLAPILKERPAIATELGQILALREAAGKSHADEISEADRHSPNLAARLTDRMKIFFGLD